MRIKLTPFLVILIVLIGVCTASAQLKKVRFSTTGISISELPFKVAQLKGFWREEGLDVETILIRGAVGMQALLGGSVDYTSASGSTIAAAVRGLPVREAARRLGVPRSTLQRALARIPLESTR